MKFAHLGDCHLGSWKQPELQELNFLAFQYAVHKCIEEPVEFVLIAGDLFDSAYPPVEILKNTFREFRRMHDAGIKCYMIAGSHDYSVSGKTFLDVLEKAGFCEICRHEEIKNEKGEIETIFLNPIKHKTIEIIGLHGKKSGLEVQDIKRIKVPETNNFRILMLHTAIKEAVGTLPIESVSLSELPKADYYALAHLHMDFQDNRENAIAAYSGPIFPNSFQEMEDLGRGSFYIVEVEGFTEAKRKEIRLKEVKSFLFKVKNAITITQSILQEFEKYDLADKIVLLRLEGIIEQGNSSDIDYQKISKYLSDKKAYSFLKNTHKLKSKEDEQAEIKVSEGEMSKVEEFMINDYEKTNPSRFNNCIFSLMHSLNLEKQEDEKSIIFENRLFSELNKVLSLEVE